MTAEDLLHQVEQAGGSLALRGDRIVYRLPQRATPLLAELKKHRDEVIATLRRSTSAPRKQCPALPRGVRLVRYEPKSPPVAVDVCSVVTDVEKFIQAELRELDARLHSPIQIRGGWGVFTILDRLRQVGLELEIETCGRTIEKGSE